MLFIALGIDTITYDARGVPASVQVGSDPATAPRYYYVYNGHGDVVALVDEQGTAVALYTYDEQSGDFGASGTTENFANGWHNPYRYDGRDRVRYDSETGLYWMSVRAYDPTIGRFISRDPLGRLAGMGLDLQPYAYAGNNPLTNMDPSGQRYIDDEGRSTTPMPRMPHAPKTPVSTTKPAPPSQPASVPSHSTHATGQHPTKQGAKTPLLFPGPNTVAGGAIAANIGGSTGSSGQPGIFASFHLPAKWHPDIQHFWEWVGVLLLGGGGVAMIAAGIGEIAGTSGLAFLLALVPIANGLNMVVHAVTQGVGIVDGTKSDAYKMWLSFQVDMDLAVDTIDVISGLGAWGKLGPELVNRALNSQVLERLGAFIGIDTIATINDIKATFESGQGKG